MLLTVFCLRRDRSELTFELQVDADFELQNFRALCALESGIPAAESQILYAEVPLTDNHRSLASYGLKDGDVVILQQVDNAERRPAAPFPGLPRIDFSSIAVPGTSAQAAQPPPPQPAPTPPPRTSPAEVPPPPQGLDNPGLLRDMLLSNPHELSLLKERNPPLAEALLSGDLEKFTRVLVEQQLDRARREQERIRLFSADPFDLEAQAKIEEDIRQQNIEENMTIAMEEAPESFGQVVMLYINCKVNGHPVKAFVDSGAQMTIMSQACAERCNIMRLVDRRWAGIAKGVGTQKIIGRVHLAQVQIEGDFLPCSFSILEEQPMDMLLGLDMLKRHQCAIDLKKNVLVIGTTGSQTAFLPEGELPECARLAYGAGREDIRPEEVADHELAAAIQKSVEEAGNTDRETTSPELSLLSSSDGCQHPVHFPEVAVKTSKCFGRSLHRSVSAPTLGSRQRTPAQTVDPRAAKSVESLPEGPAGRGREELPNLSDCDPAPHVDASLAGQEPCCSLNSPPLNTCAKTAASGAPSPSGTQGPSPGLESFLEKPEGSHLLRAAAQTEAAAGPLPSLPLELSQAGPRPQEELAVAQPPDKRLETAGSQAPPSAPGASPSPTSGGPAHDHFLPEGELKFSCEGLQRPESAPREFVGEETDMEVELTDQGFVAAGSRPREPPASSSAMNSVCSMAEAEPSKSDSSLSTSPLSPNDLKPSGRAAFEPTDRSASAGFPGSPPAEGPLGHRAEGPCPSLTSALKELHQLLVASYKKASRNESPDPPGTLPEEGAAGEEDRECPRDIWDVELSSPEGLPVRVNTEASAGMWPPGAGAADRQETLALPDQEVLITKEPLDWDSSTVLRPEAASGQPPSGECSETPPPCLPSGHAAGGEGLEQNLSPSDLMQGSGSPRVPPTSLSAHVPAAQHVCSPEMDSAPPQPPVSPSAHVDQIVRAGFTPQEASEALEQAAGNVDLALLILLAKNIVVPP